MAKPQARQGDVETCTSCPIPPYCPTGTLQMMNCVKTFVNGRVASVIGDGIKCCSTAIAIGGSSTVFIEGKRSHRLTDRNTCGVCITASPDTFVGD